MQQHEKDDGLKTKLQWMKEGYKVKKGVFGTLMWTNYLHKEKKVYYSRKEVRKSTVAIRDYKVHKQKEREKREETRRMKLTDFPLPSDALESYELPDYTGWTAKHQSVGDAVMILDTETTGIYPDFHSILQLSWQVVDTGSWEVLSKQNFYFKWPSNKKRISAQAIQVNGLTEERLEELCTTHLIVALYMLYQDLKNCTKFIGHNILFDMNFVKQSVLELQERNNALFLKDLYDMTVEVPQYCTMKNTLNLCCIPGVNRHEDSPYKYPKLIELADFLEIDYKDIELHDASGDVELTKRCYMKLIKSKSL